MKITTIGIIGFGQFGQLIAKNLQNHYIIVPYKRDTDPSTLKTCEVVIFAVPYSSLKEVVLKVRPYIKKDALIIDVTSVKQKPLAVLTRYFKSHQILGTHPIFGPQSAKNGIAGLPIVLCNVSCTKAVYAKIKSFLVSAFDLRIIELTPKEHDHEMAQVQGLTHFIGRALVNLNVQSFETDTQSYKQLLELRELLKFDSFELFKTIQNTNPEAKKVRQKFLKELLQLEKDLSKT